MPALVLVISAPAPKSRRIEVLRFLRQIKWLCLLRLPKVKKAHAMYHNLVLYAPEIWTMSKAFRTIELKMPDIVGLSPILTQKLTHFHI